MGGLSSLLTRVVENRATLWVLLALALAARAMAALLFGDFTPGGEIWEYGQQGQCAAQHHSDLCLWDSTRQPYASALMPPLTSYLWLILFNLFGVTSAAHAAYVVLNVAFGAACVPLMFAFARTAGLARGPASLAAAIVGFYPTFVFVASSYHATNFTIAFMLAFAILYLRAAKSLDWKTALLAGLFGGLAAMTRNELLLIAAAATLMLVWLGRKQIAAAIRSAAALTFAVGLVCAPWIVRNYETFHHFIPDGSQSGYNVWIGFGPYARGSGNALGQDAAANAAVGAIHHGVRPGDAPGDRFEPRLQAAFMDAAQPAIAEGGAGRIAGLAAERVALLWVFDWTDPLTHSVAYWLPWLIVQALALYGFLALVRGRAPPLSLEGGALIGLCLALFTLTYALTSIFARYRMHMEPFIFLLAAIGLWQALGARLTSAHATEPA